MTATIKNPNLWTALLTLSSLLACTQEEHRWVEGAYREAVTGL